MIKKIKIEVVEERKKKTYKNSVEVKEGSIPQDALKQLRNDLINVLKQYGLLENEMEGAVNE